MSSAFDNAYSILKNSLDAPSAAYFASCVNCGLCAEACLFYTETGDVKNTPIYKVEPLRRVWEQEHTTLGRLGKLLHLAQRITDQDLADWAPLAYDTCTLCSRCAMVCPTGVDPSYLIRKFREGLVAAGHAPEDLVKASENAITAGSPGAVQWSEVAAKLKEIEQQYNYSVPVDKEGANFLVLLSSWEILNFPAYLGSLGRILNASRYTWTLSSHVFDGTNAGAHLGHPDIARQLVQRIVDVAEGLKVECVITPECGHAYTALRWDGPNLIGRGYHFDVKHVLEVLDGMRRSGRIRLKGTLPQRLTYHDPCQLSRRGGLQEQPRNLLRYLAPEFREMDDYGTANWCCGGGGGVFANSRADEVRIKVFDKKRRQIEHTGVNTVVTACANCRMVMQEAFQHYGMNVNLQDITEIVAQHLVEPSPDEGGGERRRR